MHSVSQDFLDAVVSSHSIALHVDVYYNGVLVYEELPISEGSVTLTRTDAVRASLSMVVADATGDLVPRAPTDPLNVYGQEIHVRVGVAWPDNEECVSLGYFRIQSFEADQRWTVHPEGEGWIRSGSSITIEGLDRMAKVVDARFISPTQPPSGTTCLQEIARLTSGIVPMGITDPRVVDRRVPPGLVYEEDRGDAIAKLAASINAYCFIDGDGNLRVWSTTPTDSGLQIRSGESGVTVSVKSAYTRDGIYNVLVAKGEDSGNLAPYWSAAYDRDPLSPTRFDGPFGQVTGFFSSPFITTQAAADASAKTRLINLHKDREVQFEVEIVRNPAIEPDDILTLQMLTGSLLKVRVVSATIPLLGAETMKLTVAASQTALDAALVDTEIEPPPARGMSFGSLQTWEIAQAGLAASNGLTALLPAESDSFLMVYWRHDVGTDKDVIEVQLIDVTGGIVSAVDGQVYAATCADTAGFSYAGAPPITVAVVNGKLVANVPAFHAGDTNYNLRHVVLVMSVDAGVLTVESDTTYVTTQHLDTDARTVRSSSMVAMPDCVLLVDHLELAAGVLTTDLYRIPVAGSNTFEEFSYTHSGLTAEAHTGFQTERSDATHAWIVIGDSAANNACNLLISNLASYAPNERQAYLSQLQTAPAGDVTVLSSGTQTIWWNDIAVGTTDGPELFIERHSNKNSATGGTVSLQSLATSSDSFYNGGGDAYGGHIEDSVGRTHALWAGWDDAAGAEFYRFRYDVFSADRVLLLDPDVANNGGPMDIVAAGGSVVLVTVVAGGFGFRVLDLGSA